jgi:hypothetical protein
MTYVQTGLESLSPPHLLTSASLGMAAFGVYGLDGPTDLGTARHYRGAVQAGAGGLAAAFDARLAQHADRGSEAGAAFTK